MYDGIALEKHIYIAARAERIQHVRNIGFLLQIQKEGLSNHSINDPTLLKRKENAKRLHDEHLVRTQQEKRDIPRSQQIRQRKGQQFDGNEEYDYAVDPKTGWIFYGQ